MPPPERHRVWGELVLYTQSNTFDSTATFSQETDTSLAFTPRGTFEVIEDALRIDVDLPFAFGMIRGEYETTNGGLFNETGEVEGSALVAGNPTFGVRGMSVSEQLTVSGGLGLALPLVPTPEFEDVTTREELADASAEVFAPSAAAAARGMWNIWWYLPDTFSLVVPGELIYRANHLELGGEAALGVLVPVRDRADADADTQAMLQLGTRAAFVNRMLSVGMALRGVWQVTGDANDAFQSSLEPFGELRFGHGFVFLGVIVCLDAPLGVLDDNEDFNAWGIRTGGGASF